MLEPFTYRRLMAMPAPDLATITLDLDRPVSVRLGAFEALQARLDEIGASWGGFDTEARAMLLAALALEMADLGFSSGEEVA